MRKNLRVLVPGLLWALSAGMLTSRYSVVKGCLMQRCEVPWEGNERLRSGHLHLQTVLSALWVPLGSSDD